MDKLAGASIKYLDAVVVSQQHEGEALSTEARDLKDFEVKGVGTASLVMPSDLVRYSFLGSIDHVEKFIVVNAHEHPVSSEFDGSGYVAVLKVNFSQNHLELKNMLDQVSLDFSEVEAVVPTESQFMLAADLEHFKNSVDLQWLLG